MTNCNFSSYLRSGTTSRSISEQYKVGESTFAQLLPYFVKYISRALEDEVRAPDERVEYKQLAKDFGELWQFPGTLGAIDGCHIEITVMFSLFY